MISLLDDLVVCLTPATLPDVGVEVTPSVAEAAWRRDEPKPLRRRTSLLILCISVLGIFAFLDLSWPRRNVQARYGHGKLGTCLELLLGSESIPEKDEPIPLKSKPSISSRDLPVS